MWGRLTLPILLLRVGLLTLMKMDSLIYLDKWYNIGKFNLPHIRDRVLINIPGLKLNK